jgi:hypothetical protein
MAAARADWPIDHEGSLQQAPAMDDGCVDRVTAKRLRTSPAVDVNA